MSYSETHTSSDRGFSSNRRFSTERSQRPWIGLLAGVLGGLAASWMMNQFQTALSSFQEGFEQETGSGQQSSEQQKQKSEDSEDATMKAAMKLLQPLIGRQLSKEEKQKAGPVVHYVFGGLMGGCYGLLSEYFPQAHAGFGTVYGTALFLVADEIAVPVLGLSGNPLEYPVSSHVYAFSSHLVYGLSTEAVRRSLRAAA
jgi:putative membrane protein